MKKAKKFLTMALCFVLGAVIAIGGTLALLFDTDEDVNVMVVGNVKIEQLEYERVVDEDGNWVTSEYTGYGYTADLMQPYTQNKPVAPAFYKDGDVKWDDRHGSQAASGEGSHQQPWSQIGAPGSNQLFDDSVKNVIDKFVFVKNTGKNDAYYRTIIAVENPDDNTARIHMNFNGNSRFTPISEENGISFRVGFTYIDGVRYDLYNMTYNQVLTPGEVSRPSLLQAFINPEATNEDMATFGDTWEILVFTQAVQTSGFDSAAQALNAAFGEINANSHPWTADEYDTWNGKTTEVTPEDGVLTISTAEELAGFAKQVNDGTLKTSGLTVKLENDINLQNKDWTPIGEEWKNNFSGTFDGQGHTVYNFTVTDENNAGFFASIVGTVKNLTISNATVNGNYTAGALVGTMYGTIENCHVENSTVISTPRKKSGVYDDGNNVGGLVGYLADGKNTVTDCSVTDTTVKGYRDVGGIVGKIYDGRTTLTNNTVKNVLIGFTTVDGAYAGDKENSDLGAIYGRIVKGEPVIENNTADGGAKVDSADAFIAVLESGEDVTLATDIKIDPANMSSGYGKTGVNVKNGQTIDGNGNTLDVKGAGGTWDSGINTTGGTIKNLTVTGSFRGVFVNHNSDYSEPVVLDNVTIDGTTYTISCDQGKNQTLIATNSTFKGWTSYAATLGSASFTDCYFGEGNGYAFMRPFCPTTYVGCDFEAGYEIDPRAAITFEDCTIGGEPLTADNLSILVTSNIANASVK